MDAFRLDRLGPGAVRRRGDKAAMRCPKEPLEYACRNSDASSAGRGGHFRAAPRRPPFPPLRRIGLALAIAWVWMRPAAFALDEGAGFPAGSTLHFEQIPDWDSYHLVPVYGIIHNPTANDLSLTLELSSHTYSRASTSFFSSLYAKPVAIPAGQRARFEMPVPKGPAHTLSTHVKSHESPVPAIFDHFVPSRYPIHPNRKKLMLVDGYRKTEAEAVFQELEPQSLFALRDTPHLYPVGVAIENLPRLWQSYAGFANHLMFEDAALRRLDAGQADALGRWIRHLGGEIWVVGPDGPQAVLEAFGHDAAAALADAPPSGRRAPWLTGQINFLDDYRPEEWASGSQLNARSLLSLNRFEPLGDTDWMHEPFASFSVGIVISLLILMALATGPLNYLFVRAIRRPMLFFATTPALSIIGSLLIVFHSWLAGGVGVKYNESAVLLRQAGKDDAAVFHHRMMYAGLFAQRLAYAGETIAIPFQKDPGGGAQIHLRFLDADRLHLSGDWVVPRMPSGLRLIYPIAARLEIERFVENGQVHVVNGLPHRLTQVAARVADGSWRMAYGVEPGGLVVLAAEERDQGTAEKGAPVVTAAATEAAAAEAAAVAAVVATTAEEATAAVAAAVRSREAERRVLADWGQPQSIPSHLLLINRARQEAYGLLHGLSTDRILLVAECEGLPYLQDGELGGTLLEGRYYYVLAE